MFKACSGHESGIADVTSLYKRNAALRPFAILVLFPSRSQSLIVKLNFNCQTDRCQTFYTGTHDIVSASYSGI